MITTTADVRWQIMMNFGDLKIGCEQRFEYANWGEKVAEKIKNRQNGMFHLRASSISRLSCARCVHAAVSQPARSCW